MLLFRLSLLTGVLGTCLAAAPKNLARVPAAWEPSPDGRSWTALAAAGGIRLWPDRIEIQPRHAKRPLIIAFEGSNAQASIAGVEPGTGRAHYFLGNDPAHWRSGVERFARVRIEELYPGIGLEFYFNNGRPEYGFVLQPGADPDRIALLVSGGEVSAGDDGGLVFETGGVRFEQRRPFAFHPGAAADEAPSRYVLESDNIIRIALGEYDRALPLIIDPELVFSTYFGGASIEAALGVAIGPDGGVFATGLSRGLAATLGAVNDITGTSFNIYVAHLSPDGSELRYVAYFGGTGSDRGQGIAVDSEGAAYVTGLTFSSDFPVTNGAAQPLFGAARAMHSSPN